MPEEPAAPRPAAPGPPADPSLARPAGPVSYRVDNRLTLLKIGLGVVALAVALLSRGDPIQTGFAVLAVVVLGGYAARDVIAPNRLSADREGVTLVAGFASRRRLAWPEIETVRIDAHQRVGLRAEYLEIDTGDNLYLFSTYDLGVRCHEALDALTALRQAA